MALIGGLVAALVLIVAVVILTLMLVTAAASRAARGTGKQVSDRVDSREGRRLQWSSPVDDVGKALIGRTTGLLLGRSPPRTPSPARGLPVRPTRKCARHGTERHRTAGKRLARLAVQQWSRLHRANTSQRPGARALPSGSGRRHGCCARNAGCPYVPRPRLPLGRGRVAQAVLHARDASRARDLVAPPFDSKQEPPSWRLGVGSRSGERSLSVTASGANQ